MNEDISKDMEPDKDGYLDGQILIAMPTMSDPRFEKSIILLCAHGEDGAMGIVLNKNLDTLSFEDLLDQLNISYEEYLGDLKVHFGGPVEAERGFLLHTTDHVHETSIMIDKDIALTATMDMLKSVAEGTGPQDCLLALGYSGWGPGQLEREIQENGWLVVDADTDLVFGKAVSCKWQNAIRKLGFDPSALSGEIGHA
ncbi:YqgE/AlgH family protein [Sneathiella limimaris]|uniref:YqgE/AlgH family protein n=1 Tax=Sneathiella limimaris TaxID=1964213 RepID=UPI0019D1FA4E|nr:YqgE/AlgH family protein [Sneathiella limimaris]